MWHFLFKNIYVIDRNLRKIMKFETGVLKHSIIPQTIFYKYQGMHNIDSQFLSEVETHKPRDVQPSLYCALLYYEHNLL